MWNPRTSSTARADLWRAASQHDTLSPLRILLLCTLRTCKGRCLPAPGVHDLSVPLPVPVRCQCREVLRQVLQEAAAEGMDPAPWRPWVQQLATKAQGAVRVAAGFGCQGAGHGARCACWGWVQRVWQEQPHQPHASHCRARCNFKSGCLPDHVWLPTCMPLHSLVCRRSRLRAACPPPRSAHWSTTARWGCCRARCKALCPLPSSSAREPTQWTCPDSSCPSRWLL